MTWCLGNSHGDLKKQMYGKQMCVGPALTVGHREDLDPIPVRFFPITPVHVKAYL